jgi:hypothetical protein
MTILSCCSTTTTLACVCRYNVAVCLAPTILTHDGEEAVAQLKNMSNVSVCVWWAWEVAWEVSE